MPNPNEHNLRSMYTWK